MGEWQERTDHRNAQLRLMSLGRSRDDCDPVSFVECDSGCETDCAWADITNVLIFQHIEGVVGCALQHYLQLDNDYTEYETFLQKRDEKLFIFFFFRI